MTRFIRFALPLALLTLAACGGGGLPVDASSPEAPAASASLATQTTASDRMQTLVESAVASDSAASAETPVVARQ